MTVPRFIHVLLFILVSRNAVLAMTPTEMMADANLAGGLVVSIGADKRSGMGAAPRAYGQHERAGLVGRQTVFHL
jgi:hypothetical protein